LKAHGSRRTGPSLIHLGPVRSKAASESAGGSVSRTGIGGSAQGLDKGLKRLAGVQMRVVKHPMSHQVSAYGPALKNAHETRLPARPLESQRSRTSGENSMSMAASKSIAQF
jgi:hypothetical protein